MEEKTIYSKSGSILFKTVGEDDYWINQKFNTEWQEVEFERGPHPSVDDEFLSEEEALEFAKQLGMSEERFFDEK